MTCFLFWCPDQLFTAEGREHEVGMGRGGGGGGGGKKSFLYVSMPELERQKDSAGKNKLV